MHTPERAGKIIESCVALHNCAKVGKVKLYRDFHMKDSFRKTQARVVQPDQAGKQPKQKFNNVRKGFIDSWFGEN